MHLVLNFPGVKWEAGRTLCGKPSAPSASGDDFEITTTMSIDEIVRAATKDDKNNICNKCLAEFFDKVLPLKWELKKKEDEAAAAAGEKEKKQKGR